MFCEKCGSIVEGGGTVCANCAVAANINNGQMNNGFEQPMNNQNVQMNNGMGQPTNNGMQQPMNNQNYYQNNQMNNGMGQQMNNNNYQNNQMNGGVNPNAKSKMAAGLLGIFLGSLGVHNFYLGYKGKAIAQLLISILSLGFLAGASAIWGLIEGIMILSGSIKVDGKGIPLID